MPMAWVCTFFSRYVGLDLGQPIFSRFLVHATGYGSVFLLRIALGFYYYWSNQALRLFLWKSQTNGGQRYLGPEITSRVMKRTRNFNA